MMENVKTYDDGKLHNAVMSLHDEFMDCKETVQDDEQLFVLLRLKITQLRFKLGKEITDNLLIKSLVDQTKRKEKKMKTILITISLVIAYGSYANDNVKEVDIIEWKKKRKKKKKKGCYNSRRRWNKKYYMK